MSPNSSVSVYRSKGQRIGILAVAALLLAFLASFLVPTMAPAGSAASAPAASASILHPNLVVKNVGSRNLGICENWTHPDGQWTWSTCSGSPSGTLSKNQNSKSKYGWKDTDAVRVDKGYRLKERVAYTAKGDTFYNYYNVTTCAPSTYWLKVQPKLPTRFTREFYLKKC